MHRGPGAVLTWQIAPGAATAQQVEDAVDNPTEVDGSGTTAGLGEREQGFENGPFDIAEVARVDNRGHAGYGAPGPPRNHQVEQPIPSAYHPSRTPSRGCARRVVRRGDRLLHLVISGRQIGRAHV